MMPSETLNPHPDPPIAKSSNWLNRLRSSRGFPDSDHINLEHFLSTSTNSSPSLTPTQLLHTTKQHADGNTPLQEHDLINNLLSDLFYMGDCSNNQPKSNTKTKSCRKQKCPRICIVSSNSDVENVRKDRFCKQSTGSTLPLTLSGRRSNKGKEVNEVMQERVEVEEERVGWDVSGYSQTEVTVIDTSVACWKFDKVLYRSKNVWRVGDRKGKGLMSGGDGDGNNRKQRGNESGGNAPKKKNKLKKKLKLCNSSKGESVVLSKSLQGHEQGKMVAGNEKKRDNCSQVQEKSFGKKQIDEGSSVILIKSIPTTNKKNASGVSSSCVKSIQR